MSNRPRIQTRLITNGDQQMTVTEPMPERTREELWAAVFDNYDWTARGEIRESRVLREIQLREIEREGGE